MGAPDHASAPYGSRSGGSENAPSAENGPAERAREQVHALGERASGAVDDVRDTARGNPLAAGLVAFGAGLVAASLFPGTRSERQLASQLQPALDGAARELGDAGRSVAEQVREPAVDAARQVQQRAGDEARGAVDEVRAGHNT